jgi:hypothetical protein
MLYAVFSHVDIQVPYNINKSKPKTRWTTIMIYSHNVKISADYVSTEQVSLLTMDGIALLQLLYLI